ncbi:MAG: hypothetical protein HW396_432 [Candidatus Dadabacteria bacterium]|nr:hypothetical protein [Candidatus Dadabacteria bacterium]
MNSGARNQKIEVETHRNAPLLRVLVSLWLNIY